MKKIILLLIFLTPLFAQDNQKEALYFIKEIKNQEYIKTVKLWQSLMPIRYKAFSNKRGHFNNKAYKQQLVMPKKHNSEYIKP